MFIEVLLAFNAMIKKKKKKKLGMDQLENVKHKFRALQNLKIKYESVSLNSNSNK